MQPNREESTAGEPTDEDPPDRGRPPDGRSAEPPGERAAASGSAAGLRGAVSDRRQFLQALSASALSTTVAGCEQLELGSGPLRDLSPGDTTDYRGAFRFGDAYQMQVTRVEDGTTVVSGRFDGEDRYLRFERGGAGEPVESYILDGVGYVVVAGECTRYPDLSAGMESVASVSEGAASDDVPVPELTVTGTTTIDGREMLVLTVPAGELDSREQDTGTETASGPTPTPARDRASRQANERAQGELTYYVDAETRYPRRLETAPTVVDYRSWGAVDPITAPDLDCPTAE